MALCARWQSSGQVAALLVVLAAGGAARAGNIFDDDWTPPKRGAESVVPTPPPPAAASQPVQPPRPAVPKPPRLVPGGGDDSTPAQRRDAPVAPARVARKPVPDAAEQAKSRKVMKEVFATELADRTPAGRQRLAKELLSRAPQSADSASDQFVLLAGAVDAAREAVDVPLCLSAADAVAKAFDVDAAALKADALARMNYASATTASNGRAALAAVDELEAADDYAAAGRLAAALAAVNWPDAELRKAAQQRARDVAAKRALRDRFAQAAERLRAAPHDGAASTAVGSYYCFVKRDWATGLAYLLESDRPLLKAAATADRAAGPPHAPIADAQVAAGDAWWAAASDPAAGANEQAMRARAAEWYTAALVGGQLSGLNRLRVEKRLDAAPKPDATAAGGMLVQTHWISREATYVTSSEDGAWPAKPNFLNGRGAAYGDGFSFHTKNENQPFVVVDLGVPSTITGLLIANRPETDSDRAKTLTAYVANAPNGPWQEVWRATAVEKQWDVTLPRPVNARYVKLGLREHTIFHLGELRVFGTNAHFNGASIARPALVLGNSRALLPAVAQIADGRVRVLRQDKIVAALSDANLYAGVSLVFWLHNTWRDVPAEAFTPAATSAMQAFVRDGGDLVIFEQYGAGHMDAFEQAFGVHTRGAGHALEPVDNELRIKADAAGVAERLAKVPTWNVYSNLPEGTRVLFRGADGEPAGAVVPYGKGRLVLIGDAVDEDIADVNAVILDAVYHFKPAAAAQ